MQGSKRRSPFRFTDAENKFADRVAAEHFGNAYWMTKTREANAGQRARSQSEQSPVRVSSDMSQLVEHPRNSPVFGLGIDREGDQRAGGKVESAGKESHVVSQRPAEDLRQLLSDLSHV